MEMNRYCNYRKAPRLCRFYFDFSINETFCIPACLYIHVILCCIMSTQLPQHKAQDHIKIRYRSFEDTTINLLHDYHLVMT